MKTIFIKHWIETEKCPKQNGWYFVYYSGVGTWAEFKDGKWIYGDERNLKDYDITKEVTHWLEEVELLTDEKIKEEAMKRFYMSNNGFAPREQEQKLFMKGARWGRDFVLAVTPKGID